MSENLVRGILSILVFVIIIFTVFAGQGLVAKIFISHDRAVRALSDQGFSNINITGDSWIFVGWQGCDSGDSIVFFAEATNPVGKRVNTYVCSGILKGATIRTR